MKKFAVCYDKFCMGQFSLSVDAQGEMRCDGGMGAFEMYLLSMWSDGMAVTMKEYDTAGGENRFILLLPDGSELLMMDRPGKGYEVASSREAGEGRFACLLQFMQGMEYKGFRGYEEWDEEEEMIIGVVTVNEKTLTYGGENMKEVYADFVKQVDRELALAGR